MKPCSSCPFVPAATLGLWDPAHYLLVAYLGSIRSFAESMFGRKMSCHKWNGIGREAPRGGRPPCAGWLRGAPNALNARAAMRGFTHHQTIALEDDDNALSAEEVAQRNGLDLTRLPPLEYDGRHPDPRYPTFDAWREAVNALVDRLDADPSYARTFVVPGSPLDVGVSDDDIRAAFGGDEAEAYIALRNARPRRSSETP